MKSQIILFSIFFIFLNTFCFSNPQNEEDYSQLLEIKLNKKYGFIDRAGKILINPANGFDYIDRRFSRGFSVVKNGNKYGAIDKKGNIIVKPIYDYVSDFENGVFEVRIGDKFGYIDKEGNYIWQPTK